MMNHPMVYGAFFMKWCIFGGLFFLIPLKIFPLLPQGTLWTKLWLAGGLFLMVLAAALQDLLRFLADQEEHHLHRATMYIDQPYGGEQAQAHIGGLRRMRFIGIWLLLIGSIVELLGFLVTFGG
ncbi:MAG TPA: hypothetical protein VHA78_03860 [Candidatus Peribacteraceae bacterium]|nr:hypothetical protein [Candidatus Peribacteraceae bacterium]